MDCSNVFKNKKDRSHVTEHYNTFLSTFFVFVSFAFFFIKMSENVFDEFAQIVKSYSYITDAADAAKQFAEKTQFEQR